jgi:WhiB family redox-sensing transcriptional regulator
VSVSRDSLSFTFEVGMDSPVRENAGIFLGGIKHMTWDEDWASKALCNQTRPDELFVRGAAQNRAKQLCAGCPVRTECLAEALDNQIEWGVWGGMTERERRALLRKRPNVTSWRRLLETAKADHMATAAMQARSVSA